MLGRNLEEEVLHSRPKNPSSDEKMLSFTHYGRRGVIEPFNLEIRKGEVVGLAGLLGSGRTETAEILFGVRAAHSGKARDLKGDLDLSSPAKAIAQGFGFAPEDRKTDGIVGDLSIRENIILGLQAQLGWSRPIYIEQQNQIADDYIKRLDIRTSDREKRVGELSGGNQQKVILARWLAMNPRFLILDEPTRGIDVGAHAEILHLIHSLVAKGMSLLVISSELDELVSVSNRVIVIRDRHHVNEIDGDEISTGAIMRAIAGSATTEPV